CACRKGDSFGVCAKARGATARVPAKAVLAAMNDLRLIPFIWTPPVASAVMSERPLANCKACKHVLLGKVLCYRCPAIISVTAVLTYRCGCCTLTFETDG